MKGDAKVIAALNEVLTGELTAINQYFLHASMCKNWGFHSIYEKVYKESIDEMKHAKCVIDRILFLEGVPNVQKLDKVKIGETIPEQYKADLDLEFTALERLKRAVKTCMDAQDHASRALVEEILRDEEEHVDWLETQLGMIKAIGIQNYLAENQ